MLEAGYFLHQPGGMVIVNKTDGGYCFCGRVAEFFFCQLLAYQVPQGFGAVLVALLGDQFVKAGKKLFF